MSCQRILFIDAGPQPDRVLENHLSQKGCQLVSARSVEEAEPCLRAGGFHLVLLDECAAEAGGLPFIRHWAPKGPPIVVVGSGETAASAIAAIRAGAFDVISRPVAVPEVEEVLERLAARASVPVSVAAGSGADRHPALAGTSLAMTQLREMIAKIAPAETPVLIRAETGSLKEVVAQAIHHASPRAAGPLLRMNGIGETEERMEKELFGNEATGAPGLVELARGGVLLIEEVSELTPRLQVRLLRLLQEGRLEPGKEGKEGAEVDFRLMATTSRDLSAVVARGAFRHDLFFRLNVFPFYIPPLRERPQDIAPMVACWLENHGRTLGRPSLGISPEALRRLEAHSWPGNVRELENALERATILAGANRQLEAEDFEHLSATHRGGATEVREPLLTLNELEKRHVLRALEYTNQNRTRAASLLQISVRTLRNKLHQYRQEDGTLPIPVRKNRLSFP